MKQYQGIRSYTTYTTRHLQALQFPKPIEQPERQGTQTVPGHVPVEIRRREEWRSARANE